MARVGLRYAARMNGVHNVVLRVIVASGEGQTHLQIVKRLSFPPDILMSNNHILLILYKIAFQDIVILAVPKLIFDLTAAVAPYNQNSVDDVLHMVLQAFEATAYLHRNLITHQDLFLSNFMVKWLPEWLKERTSMTRPGVYVIDLETAVEFSEDSLDSERLCSKFHHTLDNYGRPVAPELETEQPYCPFRLDMWQLGKDLGVEFQTGSNKIDQLWLDLCAPDPQACMAAENVWKVLDTFLRRTPSIDLHRKIPVLSYWVGYD